ncbi:MAG: hypothetical protein CXZ00_06470 [Acidobacteria bacterium]|nr:MAG: hypothetical protein CXZ00_06470 [Acidobacteriota bacterium]
MPLTWCYFNGSIDLNGLPVSGAGRSSVETFSYYHSFGIFGRSVSALAVLPYSAGHFQGAETGAEQQYLANSRMGGTALVPVTKNQSLKFSFSNGTYIRFGGNYMTVSVSWQYHWLGRPNQFRTT